MDDRYKADRGEPTGPNCGVASLLFDGSDLILDGATAKSWTARSGKKTSALKFEYSVPFQLIPDFGPIPEGDYWIQPAQMEQVTVDSDFWGETRIIIHPRTFTNTFGRGGFFIHGGWRFGSAGCIDLSDEMFDFTKTMVLFSDPIRPNPCTIPLKVKYAQPTVSAP